MKAYTLEIFSIFFYSSRFFHSYLFCFFPVFMFINHVQYHHLNLFLVYHKTMNKYEYTRCLPVIGPMHFSELYSWSDAHALKE